MFQVGIGAAVVAWKVSFFHLLFTEVYISSWEFKAHNFTAPTYSCIYFPCEQYSLSLYKLKLFSMTFELLYHFSAVTFVWYGYCLKHRASYFDWKNEQFFSLLHFLPTPTHKKIENWVLFQYVIYLWVCDLPCYWGNIVWNQKGIAYNEFWTRSCFSHAFNGTVHGIISFSINMKTAKYIMKTNTFNDTHVLYH